MTTEPAAILPPPVKYYRHYGFHTYASWTTKYAFPPYATLPAVFSSFAVNPEAAGSRAIDMTVTCAANGLLQALWGTRSGAYGAKTQPVAVQAATPVTIRMTELQSGRLYYCNLVFDGVVPNPAAPNGLPLSGAFQYGEVTATAP